MTTATNSLMISKLRSKSLLPYPDYQVAKLEQRKHYKLPLLYHRARGAVDEEFNKAKLIRGIFQASTLFKFRKWL